MIHRTIDLPFGIAWEGGWVWGKVGFVVVVSVGVRAHWGLLGEVAVHGRDVGLFANPDRAGEVEERILVGIQIVLRSVAWLGSLVGGLHCLGVEGVIAFGYFGSELVVVGFGYWVDGLCVVMLCWCFSGRGQKSRVDLEWGSMASSSLVGESRAKRHV